MTKEFKLPSMSLCFYWLFAYAFDFIYFMLLVFVNRAVNMAVDSGDCGEDGRLSHV